MAKKKETKSDLPKVMSIFDHVKNVKSTKTRWKDISEADRKSWSTFMVNRFMSMNWENVDVINQLQKYTIGLMPNGIVQTLYCEVFPKEYGYHPYVKGVAENKFNSELVSIIKNHYLYNSDEAEDYIQLILKVNPNELKTLLKKYGKSEKEISKMLDI